MTVDKLNDRDFSCAETRLKVCTYLNSCRTQKIIKTNIEKAAFSCMIEKQQGHSKV